VVFVYKSVVLEPLRTSTAIPHQSPAEHTKLLELLGCNGLLVGLRGPRGSYGDRGATTCRTPYGAEKAQRALVQHQKCISCLAGGILVKAALNAVRADRFSIVAVPAVGRCSTL
jgi:hypothetical protein